MKKKKTTRKDQYKNKKITKDQQEKKEKKGKTANRQKGNI